MKRLATLAITALMLAGIFSAAAVPTTQTPHPTATVDGGDPMPTYWPGEPGCPK